MQIKSETSTRFSDELRSISPWAKFIALLMLLALSAIFMSLPVADKNPPPYPVIVVLGVFLGTLLACYVMLIGYINMDAGRRGMSRVLWTLIAIFVPNAIGILLYFILRKPRLSNCPQCGAAVGPEFGFCPQCRHRLGSVCPQCSRSVEAGHKFCPFCGADLATAVNS
jgi:RNA polymerase subunit RPABC4/transcription elongation factor Spt4